MNPSIRRASTAVSLLATAVCWVILLAPLVELVAHLSVHEMSHAFSEPGSPGFGPLWRSLAASAIALAAIVVLGTPLAYLLARDRLPFPRVVETGLLVPLAMPPLVIGLLLIFLVGPSSPVGSHLNQDLFGLNTFYALVVAEFYEAAPYYVLAAYAAFAGVDRDLEHEALLLGDSRRAMLRRVTIPLAAPGLAVGLSMAWARAMGAFGAVLIVAYNPPGLPMAIDTGLQAFGLNGALPYAVLLVIAVLPLPLVSLLWSARARGRLAPGVAPGLL
ncbi:MAG TPA: ABC transporter permease [Acidimicrobiales bacterium]|nr:ABC transporter permease [Acidimicrobiales bacterium]